METPQLPSDLENLEKLLADRERPEPSADLKQRVIRRVEAELSCAKLAPNHTNGWWAFVAVTAASLVLLLNFSMSAVRATDHDLRLGVNVQEYDDSVRQIREMLPELSDREVMRHAVAIQAGSSLSRFPIVALRDPSRRFTDLEGSLSEGE